MLVPFFKRTHALYHRRKGHMEICGACQHVREHAGSSASQVPVAHFRAYADILALPPAQEPPPLASWPPYNSAIPAMYYHRPPFCSLWVFSFAHTLFVFIFHTHPSPFSPLSFYSALGCLLSRPSLLCVLLCVLLCFGLFQMRLAVLSLIYTIKNPFP